MPDSNCFPSWMKEARLFAPGSNERAQAIINATIKEIRLEIRTKLLTFIKERYA